MVIDQRYLTIDDDFSFEDPFPLVNSRKGRKKRFKKIQLHPKEKRHVGKHLVRRLKEIRNPFSRFRKKRSNSMPFGENDETSLLRRTPSKDTDDYSSRSDSSASTSRVIGTSLITIW